jgi:hypothetical protein
MGSASPFLLAACQVTLSRLPCVMPSNHQVSYHQHNSSLKSPHATGSGPTLPQILSHSPRDWLDATIGFDIEMVQMTHVHEVAKNGEAPRYLPFFSILFSPPRCSFTVL